MSTLPNPKWLVMGEERRRGWKASSSPRPLGSCCCSMASLYLLSSWGLTTPLLDLSWRAFIPGVHKQLPPASKIAGGNVVSACLRGSVHSTHHHGIKCFLPPSFFNCLAPGPRGTHLAFLWAVQPAPPCCLGCFTVPRNSPAFLCTGFMCVVCRVLFNRGPSALRVILTAHLGAVRGIRDLYSVCLAYVDCLPGSASKTVTCCCFFQIPP